MARGPRSPRRRLASGTSGASGAPESGLFTLSRGLRERKGWLPGPTTGLEPGQEPGPGGGLDGHRGASGGGKVQNRMWESSGSVGRRGAARLLPSEGLMMQGGRPSLALGLRWQDLGQAECCLHAGPWGYLSAPGVRSEAAGTVRPAHLRCSVSHLAQGKPGRPGPAPHPEGGKRCPGLLSIQPPQAARPTHLSPPWPELLLGLRRGNSLLPHPPLRH